MLGCSRVLTLRTIIARHGLATAGARRRLSFYPADLARIHDDGFGEFARSAACELMRRHPSRGLVVELGCGTGISTEILSMAGFEVLGIDISPDMLTIARARAPRATFQEVSLWEAEIPPCSAVTAFGEVVNYAADPRAGAHALSGLVTRVFEALHPGGLFLFDFATPGRGDRGAQVREGDGWRIESDAVEDSDNRMLERRMTIQTGDGRREEVHRLHLYDPEIVLIDLEVAGFDVEPVHRYCDFDFWAGYAAFVAVNP